MFVSSTERFFAQDSQAPINVFSTLQSARRWRHDHVEVTDAMIQSSDRSFSDHGLEDGAAAEVWNSGNPRGLSFNKWRIAPG